MDDNSFATCSNDNTIKIWNYSQENGNTVIKSDISLKDESNMSTMDLSCKDNKHFVCCGYSGNEGIVYLWELNEENKWESREIYRKDEKFEKVRYNEEHTCIAVINENGEENVIMESEFNK